MSRTHLLPLFMSAAFLAGCASTLPPFDTKPRLVPSEATLSQREVASQLECRKGAETPARPIVRIPPILPQRALRSGYVNMIFDLDDAGIPINIQAAYATEEIFVRPAIRAVQTWKYTGKRPGELAEQRKNICAKITTKLTDERGAKVPTWTDVEAKNETYERYKKKER